MEFERAHELRPDKAEPLHWLGCAAAHRAAYEAADGYFTSALGCARPHRRSLVQRAYARVRLRRYAEALDDLRAASDKGALDADARWVMAALSDGHAAGGLALSLREAAVAELSSAIGGRGEPGDAAARAARLVDASRRLVGPERESVPLYAVALVLGGRRETAVELLEDAARRDPADHRITHTLALALLNSPSEQGCSDNSAAQHWERCVAAWGALLHDDAFWAHRRASAEARFGVTVDAALVVGLRADLRELLERRMPEGDDGGRVPPGALLQREADAARILAGAGGFPAGRGGPPLAGGPLRIAGLGLVDGFGAFAAATTAGSDAAVDADAGTGVGTDAGPHDGSGVEGRTHLTYAFSELGFAQLLLKQDKPADALAALTELRCRQCRERTNTAQRRDGSRPPQVAAAICEPDCGRFDELNPAYAGHPDKHRRLARDARGLALRARLDLGRSQLTAARPDFGAAAASWRRALVHSRELERYRETQAAVVDLALGVARAAHRAGDPSRAVDTLEAVRAITGANERGRLEGQLARLLADRGISAVNRDGTLLDAPAEDLRRSVAFNPHLLRAQVSLGVVLRGLAARRWRSGSVSGARATLREALDQLTAALAHFPDDPELTEQRDAAVADLDLVTAERQESGR
ncbi:hypothetical protein ACFQ0X_10865 [Streptomyces rectiviolaceus]|uniref:hypothetical protein n=1 Tax=Streptomyces rectiviolaceus TaxID=332591 RepID=UPI0031CEB393